MEEPIEEEKEADKEVYVEEAAPTGDSAPEQVPAPLATLLAVAGIWASCPGDQVARQGPATNSRAQGKAPTIQVE